MRKRQISIAMIFMLALSSVTVSAAIRTVTIRVKGMTCGGCALSIEKALKEAPGVEDARVSYERGEALIKYDDQKITIAKLREVINSTGFKAVEEKTNTKRATRRSSRKANRQN